MLDVQDPMGISDMLMAMLDGCRCESRLRVDWRACATFAVLWDSCDSWRSPVVILHGCAAYQSRCRERDLETGCTVDKHEMSRALTVTLRGTSATGISGQHTTMSR